MIRNAVMYVLVLVTFVATGQNLSEKYPDNYSQQFYQGMRYGFFKPDNYDPKASYPLVVYLHGSGDTVSRDSHWYAKEFQKEHKAFVLTPKCLNRDQGWGNTWTNTHTPETRKTLALVDSLVTQYKLDKSRLYIYGISMGGFGTFSVLAKEPGKFAAAYAICGGSDVKAASKLLSTPLWIFHGSDDDVVHVSLSRNVYEEIKRLGGKKVKYTEYPGVKHNSWDNANKEKELIPWLFAQKLDKK